MRRHMLRTKRTHLFLNFFSFELPDSQTLIRSLFYLMKRTLMRVIVDKAFVFTPYFE